MGSWSPVFMTEMSQFQKESITDEGSNLNAHYIFGVGEKSFTRGVATGQRCRDFQLQRQGGIIMDAVKCDQVNKRPICKMGLTLNLAEAQCPANVIAAANEQVCGEKVARVRVKQATYSAAKVVDT